MTERSVHYADGDTELTGFLASDESTGMKRPGVLLVHGGAGLDDHARGRARQLARAGYVVFACDMYGDGVAGDRHRVMAALTELRADPDRLINRASAGLQQLRKVPGADERFAAVGYCFGGMTVLELARAGAGIAGVVSVHGGLRSSLPAEPADGMAARVLVCHGALDPHVPMTDVAAFAEEMNQKNGDWQLNVYGGAMHGFTHENAGAYKVPGVAYDARADARSSRAILDFLAELFR